ncbi:MAG TPA: efflux RND transporter periplasmic adaptor subunit [Cyclobacteriaceae bacterium]|nr:efflux RND transporter periplasmic adaptor subunit [Cyclobacteriaceae bacterium]
MKIHFKFLSYPLMIFLVSCGAQGGDDLENKKVELKQYKDEAAALNAKIEALEQEIAALDTGFAHDQRKTMLVTTTPVQLGDFAHYIEVTGAVLSKKNVNISAEVAGRVLNIKAVEGMHVRRGEVLAEVDTEAIDRNIEEVEKQLELANIIFEKQKRLWDQQIGTEVQFLEAKNRKEILEKSLASVSTQRDKATIKAPFDGTVEAVNVRLGEMVQPGTPVVNFVGESDLYIEGDLSERYVGSVERGDSVQVKFPSLNKDIATRITAVGGVIDPNNRTFKIEAFLPQSAKAKPNMVAVIRIKDYENKGAVTVPTNLILQDNEGEYVFIVQNNAAKKAYIKRGLTYQGKTEILEGLKGDEVLVEKGFRDVSENMRINTVQN